MVDLEQKLEYWRSQLLDLSRRNRLIHFPAAKAGGRVSRVAISIQEPDALALWKVFAEDEKSISFPLPVERGGEKSTDVESPTMADTASELPPGDKTPPPTPAQDGSITNQPIDETQKTLRNLRQKARTYSEETGLNALYLAFGFLNWHDAVKSEDLRSPLLLVPVQLSQADLFSPFKLSRLDDEIIPNYALAQKLELEAGIVLPEFHEDDGLPSYLEAIGEVSARMNGSVELAVELSLFSFNKLSMYQDLEMHKTQVLNHPVVRAIAGDASLLNRNVAVLDIASYDHDAVPPAQVFSVLDADSSQQDAVLLAKSGASFILQGPPGTGKSQSITNIIAEFLADGKRVLFVSEKMAALEVVHRRLTQAGLGDFCLTLHHSSSKRREVLNQLEASLALAQSQASVKNSAYDQLAQLMDQRNRLNGYSRELHNRIQPLNMTIFEVNGKLATLEANAAIDIVFTPADAGQLSAFELADRLNLLQDLSRMVAERGYQTNNPWWGFTGRSVTNQLRQQLSIEIERILGIIDVAENRMWQVGSSGTGTGQAEARMWQASSGGGTSGIGGTEPIRSVPSDSATAGPNAAVPNNPAFNPGPLSLATLSFNDLAKLAELRLLNGKLQASRERIGSEYDDTVLSIDGKGLLDRCNTKYQGLARSLNSDFRADRAQIAKTRRDGKKPSYEEMLALAEALQDYQDREQEARQIYVSLGQKNAFPLDLCAEIYEQLYVPLSWFINQFQQAQSLQEKQLGELRTQLRDCAKGFADLEHYVDYLGILDRAAAAGIYGFVNSVAQAATPADQIVGAFEKCFYRAWLDAVYTQNPHVQGFRRINQDALVESFGKLDKTHLEIAKVALYSRLVARLPSLDSLLSDHDEVGKLRRELAKKRKLMPPRKLIAELPNLLPVLKPCMMMSPLAVSTYLSDNDYQFDVVLFDEASQVRTEDAICAIFRAKAAIIVGDSRQLPPTDFFQSSFSGGDDDSYDEESELADAGAFESLLEESALLPSQDLLWHYRSKHESLIAFSNAKLYSGRLTTFPSALDQADDLGVEYIHVPAGVYEPKLRRNRAEAEKVAELVFEHIEKHPDRSLGIVAFGEGQQTAIEDSLQNWRRQNPDCEQFFKEDSEEPMFVKNLETVQGDERDTIIFSIGYGFDVDGRFPMSFGPLSREGGERRLNVAITRGRINVKLVGSILPYDIATERISYSGPKLLRDYIDYAMRGVGAINSDGTAAAEAGSLFEAVIYDFLVSKGFHVDKNVGCSGYRLDLAVRHPDHAGSYAIGIECDGASYAGARTARDRDRQRQSVLRGMGWKLYRVWSTDWVKDPVGEGERLVAAVERAIDGYTESVISGVLETVAEPDYLEVSERHEGDSLPQTEYFGRPAEQVPISDISRIMLEIVSRSYGIDEDGLYHTATRCYGWARLGSVITARFNEAYVGLLRRGDLRVHDGKVELGDGTPPPVAAAQVMPVAPAQIQVHQSIVDKLYECLPADGSIISKQELFAAAARVLGWNAQSESSRAYLESAYSQLLTRGSIHEFADGTCARL